MSKKSEAEWQAAYRVADSLYTTQECGCLVLIMVDMPDVVKDSKDEIVRESLAGRSLKRCKRGDLPPLHCHLHEAEYQARKAARV